MPHRHRPRRRTVPRKWRTRLAPKLEQLKPKGRAGVWLRIRRTVLSWWIWALVAIVSTVFDRWWWAAITGLWAFICFLLTPSERAPIAAPLWRRRNSRGPELDRGTESAREKLPRAAAGTSDLLPAQLSQYPVLNPVLVPPLNRVHHLSVHEHREVQMIAAGKSGHAALAELLFLGDHVSDLDGDR